MVSTVKLVLDDVVEDLQQEEDQVVVGGAGVQEPWRAERLKYTHCHYWRTGTMAC